MTEQTPQVRHDGGIRIKGWNQFQHFKDRRPPWIKLYRDILDDPEWHDLDGDAAKHLVMLWLIASETDGYLPDIKRISFRLRVSVDYAKSLISKLKHWLDITMISSGYQDDTPETETERETEKKEGANAPLSSGVPRTLDLIPTEPDVEQSAFDAYNAMAARVGIPLAQKFDQTRRAKLRQRLKDCGGLSGWVDALEKLSKSSHCTGSNDRGWRADFDFLLQNQSFTRLMEGRYDDRKPQQPSHQPKSRIASNDEIRRRLAAAAGVKLDNGRESS